MTNPMYPSLIPRYVDESWFASDQPVDEAAKLNELEANHEVWIREAQYRNADVHTPRMDTVDDADEDNEDDGEMNDQEMGDGDEDIGDEDLEDDDIGSEDSRGAM